MEDSDNDMEDSDSEMENSHSKEDPVAEEELGQEMDFEGGDMDKSVGVAEEDAVEPQITLALHASLPGTSFAVTPRSSTGAPPFQIRDSAPFTPIPVDDHFFSEDEDNEEVERSLIEEEENSEVNDDADAEGMAVKIEEAEEGNEDVVDPASIPLPATPQVSHRATHDVSCHRLLTLCPYITRLFHPPLGLSTLPRSPSLLCTARTSCARWDHLSALRRLRLAWFFLAPVPAATILASIGGPALVRLFGRQRPGSSRRRRRSLRRRRRRRRRRCVVTSR